MIKEMSKSNKASSRDINTPFGNLPVTFIMEVEGTADEEITDFCNVCPDVRQNHLPSFPLQRRPGFVLAKNAFLFDVKMGKVL